MSNSRRTGRNMNTLSACSDFPQERHTVNTGPGSGYWKRLCHIELLCLVSLSQDKVRANTWAGSLEKWVDTVPRGWRVRHFLKHDLIYPFIYCYYCVRVICV